MPMRTLLLALTLAVAACDAPANTQFLPIGSKCNTSGACGTGSYDCAPGYPGGYCEKLCTLDGDCPLDSVCAVGKCRRRCMSATDATMGCRAAEGYQCRDEGATSRVCDVPSVTVAPQDQGMPSD